MLLVPVQEDDGGLMSPTSNNMDELSLEEPKQSVDCLFQKSESHFSA